MKFVEGMQLDRGYLSPYFVTGPESMEAVLENPFILISEKKISSMRDILPMLEQVTRVGKSVIRRLTHSQKQRLEETCLR